MIVKDEEELLGRALGGLSFADEIVVVDTGSTDSTKEIAARFTDKIYDFTWRDDFAAARNYSFSKGTADYLMWLDADDVVTRENAEKLARLKETVTEDVVYCLYDAAFGADGKPVFSYYRERLVRRDPRAKWVGFVHECIAPFGKTTKSDIRIEHRPSGRKNKAGRNLEIYKKAIARGTELNARDLFYYGRELVFNGFREEGIAVIREALRKPDAFYVNCIEGLNTIAEAEISLKNPEKAKKSYLESFLFGEPRARALNGLGRLSAEAGALKEAVFWFKAALNARDHSSEGDFERAEERALIPYIELSAALWRLGDYEGAKEAHLKAKALNPRHPSVIFNEKFFDR